VQYIASNDIQKYNKKKADCPSQRRNREPRCWIFAF